MQGTAHVDFPWVSVSIEFSVSVESLRGRLWLMRVRRRIVPLALSLLAVASSGAAAADAERVIGRKTTSGGFADAAVSGSIAKPVLVRVRVTSTPVQFVQVTWKLRCTKGKSAATRQGQFRAQTPVTRRPLFPMTAPDRCSLSATAQLEQQGTLALTLLGR